MNVSGWHARVPCLSVGRLAWERPLRRVLHYATPPPIPTHFKPTTVLAAAHQAGIQQFLDLHWVGVRVPAPEGRAQWAGGVPVRRASLGPLPPASGVLRRPPAAAYGAAPHQATCPLLCCGAHRGCTATWLTCRWKQGARGDTYDGVQQPHAGSTTGSANACHATPFKLTRYCSRSIPQPIPAAGRLGLSPGTGSSAAGVTQGG